MVVAYHAGVPGASSGFVGVDVFFVISGYLITSKLFAERGHSLSAALAAFYAQRARRILPALGIVLLAVLALGEALLLPSGEQQNLGKSALAAAMFAANLFFWRRGDDYFADPTAVEPLLHTWSLSVEEQLYLVWPLLLLVLGGAAQSRTSGRIRLTVTTLAIVTGLSFGLWLWLSHVDAAAAFFLAPARLWELGSGGLLAIVLDRSLRSSFAGPLATAGLLLILSTAALHDIHPVPHPLIVPLAVLGTLLVIAGGTLAPLATVNRLLALRWVALTGSVSYAWYLWHWPLIAFGRLLDPGDRNLLRDGLLALVAYGLAYLSTRYVEMPIRNGAVAWLRKPRSALIWASVCSLSIAGVGVGVWKVAERERRALLAPESLDCLELGRHVEIDGPCRLAVGEEATIFLLGDSHANHWSPAVSSWANDARVNAFERSRSNCPVPLPAFSSGGKFRGAFVSFPEECIAFSKSVLREAEEAGKNGGPTGVVLSAHWETYVPAEPDEGQLSGIEQALEAAIRRLGAAGVRVFVVGPTPEFRLDPAACVARRNDDSCLLARSHFEQVTLPVTEMLVRVTAQQQNARYWAPASVYCDDAYCRPSRGRRLTFRDYGHLSRFGAELALEPLAQGLGFLATRPRTVNAGTPGE